MGWGGSRPLSATGCWPRNGWGWIGLVVEGHPEIFPVNHVLLDALIVFRTAPDLKSAPGLGATGARAAA